MFAVSASKTMASARFKVNEPQREIEPVAKFELPRLTMLRAERVEHEKLVRRQILAAQELEDAARVLSRFSYGAQNQRIARIISRICKATKVHPNEVMSERRNREVVAARHAIMYWACRLTRFSLPQIGNRIGGRDHTTVIAAIRRHRARREQQGRYLRPAR